MSAILQDLAIKKTRIADDTDLERALGVRLRWLTAQKSRKAPNIVAFKGFVEDVSNSIIWLVFPWAHYGNLQYFVALVDWKIPERISLVRSIRFGSTAEIHPYATATPKSCSSMCWSTCTVVLQSQTLAPLVISHFVLPKRKSNRPEAKLSRHNRLTQPSAPPPIL